MHDPLALLVHDPLVPVLWLGKPGTHRGGGLPEVVGLFLFLLFVGPPSLDPPCHRSGVLMPIENVHSPTLILRVFCSPLLIHLVNSEASILGVYTT